MIEFRNVSKTYDTGTEAVHNANFIIEKGEFAFLVGSSGSGKSTLIKLILKEEEPTKGNIIINGKDTTFLKPSRVPYLRRSMGVVFQDFRLLPDKTVYDNVAYAMYIVRATPKHIRRQVPMVLSLVGLSHKAKVYPNELSGGEQQRVALARALVNNPSMLIADEPTGNLDPETAWDIMTLLNDINARGTTVVVATHAKDIVDRMKKRVIQIEEGNIIRDDIIVKYSVLGYLIGEGFRNFFKNKKSTIASLIIMFATMFVFGIFFVIGENVNHVIAEIEAQQGMQVFINKNASKEQEKELENQIREIEYVNNVVYKSKEDALNQMKVMFKNTPYLAKSYEEDNPFPASYVVTLTNLEKSKEVQEQILKFDNVLEIQTKDDTINALINIANGVRIASGVILVILIFISIFIISNTIKLTVHARRKEISIMKYVGATNGFIRWPFMVEGILIGVIASFISILVLGITYNVTTEKIITSLSAARVHINLLTFSSMFNLLIVVYLILGIGIGTIGSAISMKKYLEV